MKFHEISDMIDWCIFAIYPVVGIIGIAWMLVWLLIKVLDKLF